MATNLEQGICIRLVCGACDKPLVPTDEGSAPYFVPVHADGTPSTMERPADETGLWSIDLSDMGCPGIEGAWVATYADDESPGWADRWHAFCETHYRTWRCDIVTSPPHLVSPDPVATPQEGTQDVSTPVVGSDGTPMFDVVAEAEASIDTDDVVHVRACTSDDPANHQGDTCPVHEGDDA